jgi:hypothetical protein
MFWQRLYNWVWEMARERRTRDTDPELLDAAVLRRPTGDEPRTFPEFVRLLLER